MEREELKYEMQEGYVISGESCMTTTYRISYAGRHFASGVESISSAIKLIARNMEKDQYWPGVFYANDHGNVDVLAIFRRGKGYSYRILESWV